MGADDKSNFKKCGEILIDFKTKNKNKRYNFNCGYCDENYGQLKKFYQHIAKQHLKDFPEGTGDIFDIYVPLIEEEELTEDTEEKPIIYVPEVKLEELVKDTKLVLRSRSYNDPLRAQVNAILPSISSVDELLDKDEKKYANKETHSEEDEDYSISHMEIHNHDEESNLETSEKRAADEEIEVKSKKVEFRKLKKKKVVDTDVDSDNSQDSDFDFEEEVKKVPINLNKRKRKRKPPQTEEWILFEKKLTITLLEAFERQPNLWDVDYRKHNKRIQQDYELITKEINEKLKNNIKWEEVRKRFHQLRFDYTLELEKQRRGQEYKIPWYAEHMKYLEDNVQALLKRRYEKFKYKPLTTMDENELSILIELYKNNEILWNKSNLAFGITTKKTEILEEIRHQFNQINDLNIIEEDFHRRITYIHRLYSKDKERELKCELEKLEFVPSSPFYKDLNFLNESQGPFKCPTCNEVIERFESYYNHVAAHTNVLAFICPLCQKGFNKFYRYTEHTRRHLGTHSYYCNVCGKGYLFKSELDRHVLAHTGDRPYLCQMCGEGFKSRAECEIHFLNHENRFRFQCEMCKEGFNNTNLYKTHIKTHHNICDFLCNICGEGFTTQNDLTRHQEMHEDTKDYQYMVLDNQLAGPSILHSNQKVCETTYLKL